MTVFIISGVVLITLGCTAIYLSSPNQRWRVAPWPAAPARFAALLLLAAGCASLMYAMQFITTVFVLVTQIMLLLAIFPYLGAWRDLRRNK